MNIVYISSAYPSMKKPHYCIYLEQQARALQKLGHTVQVIVPNNEVDGTRCTSMQNGVLVHRIKGITRKIHKILPFYSVDQMLAFLDWDTIDVVSLHLGNIVLYRKITKYCHKKHIPVVFHFHGLNVWKEYYSSSAPIVQIMSIFDYFQKRKLSKRVQGIVGVSDKVCDEVRKHNLTTPLFTVYNGVDTTLFSNTTATPVSNKHFRILCVANLIRIKGQNFLIEAVAQLKREGKATELVLIGVGPELENLTALCKELDILENVSFLGACSYEKVADEMRKADMFIMPSYFEAFGCVFLEAMSCGTLTCGCKGTGADEIITDGVNGILIDQRSSSDIMEAVSFALGNPKAMQEIVQNGIERAAEFTWEKSAKSLERVYKEVLLS